MGAEFSVSVALPVRQQARSHRLCIGDRASRDRRKVGGSSGRRAEHSAVRRGDADPALRQRAQLDKFAPGEFCAPNATWRAQLTPSGRGKRPATDEELTAANSDHRSPNEKRRSMTLSAAPQARVTPGILPPPFGPAFWLFLIAPGDLVNIDVSTCVHCGGTLRIVASIEQPTAIRAILAHFEKHGALQKAHYRPAPRAPPAVAA